MCKPTGSYCTLRVQFQDDDATRYFIFCKMYFYTILYRKRFILMIFQINCEFKSNTLLKCATIGT